MLAVLSCYNIESTSKASKDGIGLRLFVSKAIVQAHGGKNGQKITQMEKVPHFHSAYQSINE